MRSTAALLASLLVPLAALPASRAAATTIVLRPLEELVRASDRITRGTVVSESCARDASGTIWTTYALRVGEELLRPGVAPGSTLEVRVLGGTLGDETQLALGFPYLRLGERVLLFTRGEARGTSRIVNALQGALRIRPDPRAAGGSRARLLVPEAPRLHPDVATRDLAAFEAAVRRVLDAGVGSRP